MTDVDAFVLAAARMDGVSVSEDGTRIDLTTDDRMEGSITTHDIHTLVQKYEGVRVEGTTSDFDAGHVTVEVVVTAATDGAQEE